MDQTQLSEDFCHLEDDLLDGQLRYGLPYSKMNCEVFFSADINSNCSMAHFYGVHRGNKIIFRFWHRKSCFYSHLSLKENSLRPCEPKDVLERPLSYQKDQSLVGQMSFQECLPFCQTTEYLFQLSEGAIDSDAVRSFNSISQMNTLGNPE